MAMIARKALVSGVVQGVFFRASTRQQALALNLTGKAINLPDGRVEVHVYGESTDVEGLLRWLRRGPEHARVANVRIEALPWSEVHDFTTG